MDHTSSSILVLRMLSSLVILLFIACVCFSSVVSAVDLGRETVEDLSDRLDEELSNMTTATLMNILQQQGVDVGDNYFSKDELKRLVKMSIERDEEEERRESEETATSTPTERKSAGTPPTTAAVSKADPSVWQQVKDQLRSDIAPFLALVPAPVKSFVHKEVIHLGKTLNMALRGAVSPMLITAAKLLDRAAQLLIHLAEKLKTRNQELKSRRTVL